MKRALRIPWICFGFYPLQVGLLVSVTVVGSKLYVHLILNYSPLCLADSSRILFATWWIYIVILTSFYTANLTAFMTFNGLSLPVTSVFDLNSYGQVRWLATEDDAIKYFIEVS